MDIISFILPIFLGTLAILISTGKADFLIAGYNTASKEEKSKIDEKALSKFLGKLIFILAIIQLAVPIATIMNINSLKLITIWTNIIFVGVTIAGVIYMNVSKKFEKYK